MQCMVGAVRPYSGIQGSLERPQVPEEVEHLVADKLVRETQPFGVENALAIHHHGIVESASQGKSGRSHRLDILHAAEGPGGGYLPGKIRTCEGVAQLPDGRIREVDLVAQGEIPGDSFDP